jgi:hypothetical protein
MDKTTEGADLSGTATAEAANEDMGGAMNQDQFATWLVNKGKAKAEPVETDTEAEPAEVTATETAEEPATAETAETEATAEGETTEGEEQPEEQPDAAEDEVLSKSDSNKPDKVAKWQEKVQKRINEMTAKNKLLEERAKAAEEKAARLEAQAPQVEEKVVHETIPISDPSDFTAKATSDQDLEKLAQEAQSALDIIESSELAIARAAAQGEEEVTLADGSTMKLAEVVRIKRDAKRHLDKFIPARREFLTMRKQSLEAAKIIRPQILDKSSQEYQNLQQFRRKFPAANGLPTLEAMFAYATIGMETVAERQKKAQAPVVKKASEAPPKTAGDTTSAAAPAKARGNMGEKAKVKAELDKAKKEYESTGSKSAYARTLLWEGKLKRIS